MNVAKLNRFAFVAAAAVALVSFYKRNALPSPRTLLSPIAAEPLQRPTGKAPFSVTYAGVSYAVEPQYEYELNGLVVSLRQHDGNSRMHLAANDHLNVADLCVVWGETAASPYLGDISFFNGIFTCNFQTRSRTAWDSIHTEQISNNHLISNDDGIRDRVRDVTIGDQIRVRGWLASYGSGGNRRGTSTTRTDTGDGACETIYIDDFEITLPAQNPWRAALYASLAVLALTTVVHFKLPYRPYA